MFSQIRLELHYLPPIQFFTKFLMYEKVWIEQHEHYLKGSYRNRCHLAGPNGLLRLSIPLQKGKNAQQSIQDVKIAYHEAWQTQHWNSIQSAYGNAPYFDYYAPIFQDFYQQKPESLFLFNLTLLKEILELLQMDASYQLTTVYEKTLPSSIFDFTNGIFPKKHRQKEDPLFNPVRYPQVFEEKSGFLPNLSILDLLFCVGPEAILILKKSIKSPT